MPNNPLLSPRKLAGALVLTLAVGSGAMSGRAETVRIPKTDNPAIEVDVQPGWTVKNDRFVSAMISPGNATYVLTLSMLPHVEADRSPDSEIAAETLKASEDNPYSATEPGAIDGKAGTIFISKDNGPSGSKTDSRVLLVKVDSTHFAMLVAVVSSPLSPTVAKELATEIAQLRFTGLDAGAAVAKGRAADARKEYDLAIAYFNEAIRLDSNFAEAFQWRGLASQYQHNVSRAFADYTQAIALNPDLPGPHTLRGIISAAKRDFTAAFADYAEALRIDPESSATYANRGLAYSAQKDFARAISDFNTALQISPVCYPAYGGRAWVYMSQGEFARALADYDQAIRLRPDASYCTLAALLRATASDEKIRDGPKAVELATQACELTAWKEPLYLHTLAAAYAEVGKFDAAVKWEQKYLATKPTQVLADDARARLGLYQQRKPYHQPAESDPKIAGIRLTEGDSAAALAKGKAANISRDYDLAISAFNEALRLDPSDADAFSGRGFAYYSKNDFERALADCSHAIAIDPSWFAPYTLRGRIRVRQRDFPKALIDFNEAIRLKADLPWIFASRGNVYVEQDDFARGLADFDEAIRLDPNRAFPYVRRAEIYLLQDEVARALADFDHALRLDPGSAHIYNSLAWSRATTRAEKFRDGVKAVELATKACELSEWKVPSYVDTLAAAYAEAGKFDDAVKWETKYLAGNLTKEDTDRAHARLSLYQQKKPYREPRRSPSPAFPEKAAR